MKTERTVSVVDDDEGVRDSLGMLFRTAGLRVQLFDSATRFLESRVPCTPPCCLVLDVRMSGPSGLALQEVLAQRGAPVPIVFITGHGNIPMAVEAVKKGAYDFIEKPFDDHRLLCQVLNAIEESTAAGAPARMPAAPQPDRLWSLSAREREVLQRVLQGKSSRQVGEELFISTKTVDFHRARIMQKLGVRSTAQLFHLCLGSNAHGETAE
jgi:FixJ family two-component response regulator